MLRCCVDPLRLSFFPHLCGPTPMPDRLVIIPTYNEKENIRDILAHVLRLEPPFHLLVVDDGSPDGTADIVREI